MTGEARVFLPDFSVHARLWIVDLKTQAVTSRPRAAASGAEHLGKGFVKKFAIGGPLGVLEWQGQSFLISSSGLTRLDAPQVNLAGKWTALYAHVSVQVGNQRKHFIDVTPVDAIVRVTDPTWDKLDQEASDVVSALMRWTRYAKHGAAKATQGGEHTS